MNEAKPSSHTHPGTVAWIALGANLGDAASTLQEAMDRIAVWSVQPVQRSSLWQSDPVDCPPGSPLFVNAAMRLVTLVGESAESLLAKLQAMERELGRRPKQVINEPRPLDLDLIGFGDETRQTELLILPHPRAHQRAFVLAPLCEIEPELKLPGWAGTARELLGQCRPADLPRRKW